jgi:predicted outer membrane repeat protein
MLIVDGDAEHRVFSVREGVVAELRGFKIRNGKAPKRIDHHSCGGLMNAGELKVVNSDLFENSAQFGGGGGMCNSGILELIDSAVQGNTAKACAGIFNNGALTLTDSTVSGNTAEAGGGGICSSGTLTLSRSSVVENSATYAGGIESSGKLTVSDSTLEDNVSAEAGAGIFNVGEATLTNSTLSGSVEAEERCILHITRASKTVSFVNTEVVGCCSGRTELIVSDGQSSESPGDTCGLDEGGR